MRANDEHFDAIRIPGASSDRIACGPLPVEQEVCQRRLLIIAAWFQRFSPAAAGASRYVSCRKLRLPRRREESRVDRRRSRGLIDLARGPSAVCGSPDLL